MKKHGDITTFGPNSESIYIDYCKLDLEGCEQLYKYFVDQLKRRKENDKENKEVAMLTNSQVINEILSNGGMCYITTKDDEGIQIIIDKINYGSPDELPTFEAIIPESIHRPNRKNISKVSYRDYYKCPRQDAPTLPEIKDVIFNPPATIILWEDNTKTVVKCQEGYEFDPWTGLMTAIVKKVLGNKGNYCNTLKKWIDKYETETVTKLSEVLESIGKVRPFCISDIINTLLKE